MGAMNKRVCWQWLELMAAGLLVVACTAAPQSSVSTATPTSSSVATSTAAWTSTPILPTPTPLPSPTRAPAATATRLPAPTPTPAGMPLPPTRRGAGLVYDEAHGQLVLFGGIGIAPQGVFSDTWLYDGVRWARQLTPVAPPARDFGSLVYDGATQTVLLFGGVGMDGLALGDIWVWDGHAWAQQHPAVSPQARGDASLTYDAQRHIVVLFGGATANANEHVTHSLNDTWTWNGRTWTQLHPAASPLPRLGASLAYDPVHQEAVLFGGGDGRAFDDTWLWNGHTWARQMPPSAPAARVRAAFAYDPVTQQLVLFGGEGLAEALTDTWTWDGTTWTASTAEPGVGPTALESRLVYDAARRELLLFLITGGKFAWATSIWVWNGMGWTLAG